MEDILLYLSIPSVVLIGVSFLANSVMPGPKASAALQHLAAGIIFASIATEIVPELLNDMHLLTIVIGYGAGMLLIFAVRSLDTAKEGEGRGGLSFTIAGGVDLLIDGFLMGVAFSVAESSGILLTIAIGFEVLFLGFTFSVSLANKGLQKKSIVLVLTAMSILLFFGGVLGFWVLKALAPQWQVCAMAFGAVALLYLVTEELLTEAHETKETFFGPLLLFLGFGGMLVAAIMI